MGICSFLDAVKNHQGVAMEFWECCYGIAMLLYKIIVSILNFANVRLLDFSCCSIYMM